ncbi:hypothetical protein [Agrobacterium fabrum]|uniref:hypothetical protein n=1 Tax=Agrobacterium fabrum TaxID=1176649 RepID=UPI003BA2E187
MWEAGQKTKQIYFWLTLEDVSEFSLALQDALPLMQWRCSHSSPDRHLIHHFDALMPALECGQVNPFVSQAFAPLALSQLQFLIKNPAKMTGVKDGYAPDYVFPPSVDMVDYGHMGIRWNTGDGDDATQALLAEQLKTIWKVFQRSTLPAKVHTLAGRPLSRFRIGKRMADLAKIENLYLKSNGPFCRVD